MQDEPLAYDELPALSQDLDDDAAERGMDDVPNGTAV